MSTKVSEKGIVFFSFRSTPIPITHSHHQKNIFRFGFYVRFTRERKIRIVGFVHKKLFMYFDMLILPHAPHCVDGCCFVFYSFWQSGILFWSQCTPPPNPATPPGGHFFRFGFFVKIHLLENTKLELQSLYLKVIRVFRNVDCSTCSTLCSWLLIFFVLAFLTVWHTVLESVPIPPPPLRPPTSHHHHHHHHYQKIISFAFCGKFHLPENSK